MYVSVDGQPGSANVWPREDDFLGFFQGVKQYYGEVATIVRFPYDEPNVFTDATTSASSPSALCSLSRLRRNGFRTLAL